MASRWTSPHFVASLIVPMVAAVVLFAVALPRLSAAVAELPARPAIEKIHSGEHISPPTGLPTMPKDGALSGCFVICKRASKVTTTSAATVCWRRAARQAEAQLA